MSRALEPVSAREDDPAGMGWPPTLPLEVAMKEMPIKDICKSYGLDKEDWDKLRLNPAFVHEVAGFVEELKKDGVSFKMKARLQAEELLKSSWKIIHDRTGDVPANVKADLIKSTMRWAGYDAKDNGAGGGGGTSLQIQINL